MEGSLMSGDRSKLFDVYKINSLNKNIKGLQYKEKAITCKIVAFEETIDVDLIELGTNIGPQDNIENDMIDTQKLVSTTNFKISTETGLRKYFNENYLFVVSGEIIKPDGSNAFVVSDLQVWDENAETHDLQLSIENDTKDIVNMSPLIIISKVNDAKFSFTVKDDWDPETFSSNDLQDPYEMKISYSDYGLISKAFIKANEDVNDVSLNLFDAKSNLEYNRAVPIEVDVDTTVYFPMINPNSTISPDKLTSYDDLTLETLLKMIVPNSTAAAYEKVGKLLESCILANYSWSTGWSNYRWTQAQIDALPTQKEKDRYSPGDLKADQYLGGVQVIALTERKDILDANDMIINLFKLSTPSWKVEGTEEFKLYTAFKQISSCLGSLAGNIHSAFGGLDTSFSRYALPLVVVPKDSITPSFTYTTNKFKIISAFYNLSDMRTLDQWKDLTKTPVFAGEQYISGLEIPDTLKSETVSSLSSDNLSDSDWTKYPAFASVGSKNRQFMSLTTNFLANNTSITGQYVKNKVEVDIFKHLSFIQGGSYYETKDGYKVLNTNGFSITQHDTPTNRDKITYDNQPVLLYYTDYFGNYQVNGTVISKPSSAGSTGQPVPQYWIDKLNTEILKSLGFTKPPKNWILRAKMFGILTSNPWYELGNQKKIITKLIHGYQWTEISYSYDVDAATTQLLREPFFNKQDFSEYIRRVKGTTEMSVLYESLYPSYVQDWERIILKGIWIDEVEILFSGTNGEDIEFKFTTHSRSDETNSKIEILL